MAETWGLTVEQAWIPREPGGPSVVAASRDFGNLMRGKVYVDVMYAQRAARQYLDDLAVPNRGILKVRSRASGELWTIEVRR
jgi:hypothetical protein